MVTAGVWIVQIGFPEKTLQVYGAWRVKIFRNEGELRRGVCLEGRRGRGESRAGWGTQSSGQVQGGDLGTVHFSLRVSVREREISVRPQWSQQKWCSVS